VNALNISSYHVSYLLTYRPEYPEEEMEEENIVEDDAELTLNKVEDNVFGVSHINLLNCQRSAVCRCPVCVCALGPF